MSEKEIVLNDVYKKLEVAQKQIETGKTIDADFAFVNLSKDIKDVPAPNKNEVKKYLLKWDLLENYSMQENALDKLYKSTYKNNIDIDEVLIKASSLNDFYSTNIFSIFPVAKHIVNLNIDERLLKGDITLVNEISKVEVKENVVKNFYSFATKYCSHHNDIDFPIYDSYVDIVLRYFRKRDNFYNFKNGDLKNYYIFKIVLLQFRIFYKLDIYTLKEIDKYLWLLGKDYFPKSFNNNKNKELFTN